MARRKVPKSIAGMKIPKAFRRRGVISAVLSHPVGRTVVAEALVAAAGAAALALSRGSRPDVDEDRRFAREDDRDDGRRRASTGGLGAVVGEIVRTVVADRAGRLGRDGGLDTGKKKKKKGKKARRDRDRQADAVAAPERPRPREEARWGPPADPHGPH